MRFARTAISLLVLAAIASTAAAEPAKTREQVKAELREAIRTGNVFATGDSGLKLNEMYPHRYPQTTVGETKTREQVKAELAEALRSGTIVSGDTFGYENLVPARHSGARFLATGNGGKSDAASMN
jgi:DNA-binding GntR family transcriptional regulator